MGDEKYIYAEVVVIILLIIYILYKRSKITPLTHNNTTLTNSTLTNNNLTNSTNTNTTLTNSTNNDNIIGNDISSENLVYDPIYSNPIIIEPTPSIDNNIIDNTPVPTPIPSSVVINPQSNTTSKASRMLNYLKHYGNCFTKRGIPVKYWDLYLKDHLVKDEELIMYDDRTVIFVDKTGTKVKYFIRSTSTDANVDIAETKQKDGVETIQRFALNPTTCIPV